MDGKAFPSADASEVIDDLKYTIANSYQPVAAVVAAAAVVAVAAVVAAAAVAVVAVATGLVGRTSRHSLQCHRRAAFVRKSQNYMD